MVVDRFDSIKARLEDVDFVVEVYDGNDLLKEVPVHGTGAVKDVMLEARKIVKGALRGKERGSSLSGHIFAVRDGERVALDGEVLPVARVGVENWGLWNNLKDREGMRYSWGVSTKLIAKMGGDVWGRVMAALGDGSSEEAMEDVEDVSPAA
ncbi:hypothetical protein HOG48_05365 [Candidatus Peregrinibacteria bacterium]|jgi:hypothetical protein|nr:hypothetical protein [Candidatus Peregrinibacteria bacterium]